MITSPPDFHPGDWVIYYPGVRVLDTLISLGWRPGGGQ